MYHMRLSNNLRALARGAAVIATVAATAASGQSGAQIDVSANSAGITRTRAVDIGDLNLANSRDRGRLDRRLKVAAGSVCDVWDTSMVRPRNEYGHCYSIALGGARSQVAAFASRSQPSASTAG